MNPDHPTETEFPTAEDDQIGRLLRFVGPREEVPVVREERVKAVIRDVWRGEVRRRLRRRTASWAAGALAVAALLLLALGLRFQDRPTLPAPPADVVASVEMASDASGWTRGEGLAAGTELETPAHAQLALRLAGDASLRLDGGTRLRLVSASALELETGTIYVDSGSASASVEITTPFGVARDVGTRFEVRVDGESLRLRVRDGAVELERPASTHTAGAGEELAVDAGGEVVRSSVAVYGDDWDWVLRASPRLELAGRSLQEILDWTARETGWEVQATDDAVLQSKLSEFVDLGSQLHVSPDQVPDVLPTFGLKAHLDGGTLRIEPF